MEPGRTSWTAVLDAVRLGPNDDVAEVTAAQVRAVLHRLIEAEQWKSGDSDVLVVFDAGYDLGRLALLLADLPVDDLDPSADPEQLAARSTGADEVLSKGTGPMDRSVLSTFQSVLVRFQARASRPAHPPRG